MSLLADLLSKTNTKQLRKDIPPDLRRTVVEGTYKKKVRRKVVILSILVFIVFLAGFGTIYVTEMFKDSLSTRIAVQTHLRNLPRSPTIPDEKPVSLPKTEVPVQVSPDSSRIILSDNNQRIIKFTKKDTRKAGEGSALESKHMAQSGRNNHERVAGKPPGDERASDEKPSQKINKDVYLLTARTHESKNEYRQAIDYYLKALELEPANYVIMNNISGVYIRMKRFDDALSYVDRALGIKPNHVPSLVNAGIAHVSRGNLAEGEGFLVRAVALDPSNRVALYNLAVLCEKQGNYEKAFENYYKLYQMGDVDGCLGAARILQRQGRNEESARFYREILAIETASGSARQFANQKLTELAR